MALSSSDACFMQNAAELPVPCGEKRRAEEAAIPAPAAPPATGKRFTRQRSDSGISGISTATGPDLLGRAFPGFAASSIATPTSRACPDVCSARELCAAAERAKDVEIHSFQSTVTNARDAKSTLLGGRSPSATGSLTFHSISQRRHHSSGGGGVKCEEELDDPEEELRADEAQSGANEAHLMIDRLPQWRLPSAPATELCTPKFGALQDPHRQSPTESCAEAPVVPQGAAYEQCPAYEEEIFRNLQREEGLRARAWGYLESHQRDIVADHRTIMVNWLVEFADEFHLERETLFLSVAILDEFLRHGPLVKKGSLQLLGTAAMVIAVKYQEAHPPSLIQSCCSVADGSFTQAQVINAEALVLRTIRYSCAIPTTLTFLWHHLKDLRPDGQFERLAEYFALLSLSDYSLLKFVPSALSAASVLLGGVMLGRDPTGLLANMRSGYSFTDLKPIIQKLINIHQQPLMTGHITTIRRKFAMCFPPRTPISGVGSS